MNAKIAVSVFSAVLMTATAMPCHADGDSRWYLLAGVGQANTEASFTSTDVIDGDDTAFEIGGGFAFNDNFSVELTYQDFGEPRGFAGCPPEVFCVAIVPFAIEKVSVDGWTAAVRGALPVTDVFSVFGRLGVLAWDASARNPGLNDSGTDLLYGGGVAVDIGNRFGLQLSYERADVDIETVKLGARFKF